MCRFEEIFKRKKMTPKEKAKQLFDRYADEFNFDDTYRGYKEQSKQCALIVVDEIISIKLLWWQKDTNELDYWKAVKQEIEKL